MQPVELLAKAFAAPEGAKAALQALEKQARDKELRLVSLAAVEKNDQGAASLHESQEVSAGKGALWGALVGGLVGLLEGPLGVVIGAAAGAAAGGAAAHQIDTGFSREFLDSLKKALRPGSSLLLVLVEEPWAEKVVQALDAYPGELMRHMVKEGVLERIDPQKRSGG